MTAQKGKDLLVKIDDGAGGFTTVAGLRTRRLAFNAETVDITHAESANRWRELLDGAGVKRASISGRGLFKDAATDALDAADVLRRRGEELSDRDSRFRHGRRARSRSPIWNSPASTMARSPMTWRWSRRAN